MKPDGTSSFSTADEKLVSPKGNHVTEPDAKTGSAIKKCRQSNGTTWSYVFVHNSKVKKMEEQLETDKITFLCIRLCVISRNWASKRFNIKKFRPSADLSSSKVFPKKYKPISISTSLTPVCVRIVAQAR